MDTIWPPPPYISLDNPFNVLTDNLKKLLFFVFWKHLIHTGTGHGFKVIQLYMWDKICLKNIIRILSYEFHFVKSMD
jgi:hypothetical protein